MTKHHIHDFASRKDTAATIAKLELKDQWDVTIEKHVKHRSIPQNKLQRLWCNEAAAQLGDRTPEEVRGESKLWLGVPILRAENPEFAKLYDERIKGLPYETKIMLMMEPFDLSVTSLMNVYQKTRYLDAMHEHWAKQGCVLTQPPSTEER